MHRGYESYKAVCPFYRKEDGTTVECEGPGAARRLRLEFGSPFDAAKHKILYCRNLSGWMKCRIAGMQAAFCGEDEKNF